MAKLKADDPFFDAGARGSIGHATEMGQKVLGIGHLGEEELKFDVGDGSPKKVWGLYQKRGRGISSGWCRTEFVTTKNPRSVPQQGNRGKFEDGMLLWSFKSDFQKSVWNDMAKGLGMHGVNLWQRWYMLH